MNTLEAKQKKGLVAVITLTGVAGATFGLTVPLITLIMKSWGLGESVVGANAAMPALAAILLSYFFPSLVHKLGLLRLLYLCLTIILVSLFCFPLFPNTGAWFLIRFIYGGAQVGVFALCEIWITQISPEHLRARIIAVYTIFFSLGFVLGTLLLTILGTGGVMPFYAGALMLVVATLPLAAARNAVPDVESPQPMRLFRFLTDTPVAAGVAILSGGLFMATAALTPAYALQLGVNQAAAARTVTWLALGALCIPFLVGSLADRLPRLWVQLGITTGTAALLWVLPWIFTEPWTRAVFLFCIGGLANSHYSMALTLTGASYRGTMITAAIAGMTVLFSIGELVGPLLVGAAMETRPHGFSISLAAMCTVFAVFLVYTIIRSRPGDYDASC